MEVDVKRWQAMHVVGFIVFAVNGAALSTSASADTVYKAIGPDGEITYTDKPPAPLIARLHPAARGDQR